MTHNFTFRRLQADLERTFLFFLLFFCSNFILAQQEISLEEVKTPLESTTFLNVSFNIEQMMNLLEDAPKTGTSRAKSDPLELRLPMPYGLTKKYHAEVTDPIAPDLVEEHPDFKTYNLFESETGEFAGRLFVSPFGVSGLIFSGHGTVSIRPIDMHNPVIHRVSFDQDAHDHACELGEEELATFDKEAGEGRSSFSANGANKRTYKFAIVTTGEFYENYGSMAAANAAVTTAINDVNAIYLRELATDFTIVGPVHYTDPDNDPFYPDQSNGVSRTAQAASIVAENWMTSEYDLGHVLHHIQNGGSGVAGLGVVCRNIANPVPSPTSGYNYTEGGVWKGRGWSGGNVNSTGFRSLFGHELGHMFKSS